MKRPIGSSFGCTMGRRAGTISRYASRARFFIGDDVWKTRLNHCPTSAVAHNTTSREWQLLAQSGRSANAVLLSPAARDDIAIQGGVAVCPIAP
jgi:hypothetical protein